MQTSASEGLAFETEVQPRQSVTWEATGDSQEAFKDCKVTRVERYAS